ncbi:chromosome partitioning protein ParA [Vibrio sp. 10N.286.49.C2]|uniref:AAA family ATPase n=1 Tax=unclassified Vibrio TaxID=2614977 RepID=UPI000C8363AE|nr:MULTISPECIES: chromosome partitioning protein ParA [unclassified Vibrio]PMH31600.1 chromosome partitioning protein ParA [Vibrio sp. 10N.286.49.C2]PMH50622.1 chromosome partitioning protein ParA [Vibrio sp. 10N.286.49.B1]PMH82808.1 chromosome partitioning protein ParA [Vibrio sp. 10N.286.48.B7]
MFDLSKALSTKSKAAPKVAKGVSGCTLIYQSQECLDLVSEVFRFEGWNDPTCMKASQGVGKFSEQQNSHIVLLELNESSNVVEDAKAFASKLPTHKGVVVIGKEDAISTLRSLKEMGFYYVFWPVNKQEFADFLTHVNKNLKTFSGVSQQRKAKRVAIVGAKGGTGTSFIATELSSLLSTQGTDTILVDHQYTDSNIDVLMGLKDFKPKAIDEFTAPLHEMDEEGALSYLHSARKNLRLLSIDGNMTQNDILNYNQTLCELLARNTNFIVEDFSGSVDFKVEAQLLVDNFDVVVIVFDASVSAVRNAKRLYERIENLQLALSKRTRVITVANYHRPDGAFVLQSADLKKYVGADINLEIGYCKNLSHIIIDGKRAHKHDRNISRAMDSLMKLINGQPVETKGLTQWFKRASKK